MAVAKHYIGFQVFGLKVFSLNRITLVKKTYQQDSGISNFFLVIASSSWILNHSEFVQSEWDSIPQQKCVVWILSITLNRVDMQYNSDLINLRLLYCHFCYIRSWSFCREFSIMRLQDHWNSPYKGNKMLKSREEIKNHPA